MKAYSPQAYLFLIVLGFVWGSSFILIKIGLRNFTPIEVAAMRLLSAGVVLLPIFIGWYSQAKKKNFKWFVLSGLLGSGLPAFMFAFAQTKLSSSITGSLNAMTPLFALLVGLLVFKLEVNWTKWLGVLSGLIGALMLILLKSGAQVSGDLKYAAVVVCAAMFYGININIIKQKFAESRPMVIAAFPTVFMSVPALAILLSDGFFTKYNFTGAHLQSLIAVCTLGIVGTALALVAFNRLIQMTNAVFSSFTTYLIPVIALFWGMMDGEQVNLWQIVGLFFILGGVLLVNKKS
ncbi:MAG: DMT family transporter [Bacteroidetes bacterium]|nr:MAG: DMT family transporter [Bacteroidota bacterium]